MAYKIWGDSSAILFQAKNVEMGLCSNRHIKQSVPGLFLGGLAICGGYVRQHVGHGFDDTLMLGKNWNVDRI
jgi:hypothetical protein